MSELESGVMARVRDAVAVLKSCRMKLSYAGVTMRHAIRIIGTHSNENILTYFDAYAARKTDRVLTSLTGEFSRDAR